MINAKALLADLQKLLVTLESDLRQRCTHHSDVDQPLRDQYAAAKAANRTAQAYEVWRDEQITQAAVAWILRCVFVRFCEDNHLIDPPRLSGPAEGGRRQRAEDEHTLYFQKHPLHSDREYLQWVFEQVAQLPAMKELFDKRHNPLWSLGVSGDGAMEIRNFFLRRDASTGLLMHDFSDPAFLSPQSSALSPSSADPTGFFGMITANSFMKREFGKKLIEHFIPMWDLTHVIDTSGAYIPGHGTPTVILFGRHRRPTTSTVRSVMGINGEPSAPSDPARGQVWSAITDQIDRLGSKSQFVSVADTDRQSFHRHPWSIGGGGANRLAGGSFSDNVGVTHRSRGGCSVP